MNQPLITLSEQHISSQTKEFALCYWQNALQCVCQSSAEPLWKTPQPWAAVQFAVGCLGALFPWLGSSAAPGGNNYPTDLHS